MVVVVDFHASHPEKLRCSGGIRRPGERGGGRHPYPRADRVDERLSAGRHRAHHRRGMTAARRRVIGMAREAILERFLTQLLTRFEAAPSPEG